MSKEASGRETRASDQSANDRDQTLSDRDQTGSDRDQTASDQDQTSSDRDQQSSNDDQKAADADVASGSDRGTYDRTTEAREQATGDRETVSERRDGATQQRADTSSERDEAASLRDMGATVRDADALLRDQETDTGSSWQDILLRAAYDRQQAAADRKRAAEDRQQAAADRERAAEDRQQAAADREIAARELAEALRLRRESTALLEEAATDQLTGTRIRFLGLDEADRELERTRRRPGAVLMIAFVDVDGLKHINDSKGHLAGDALLRLVGRTLTTNLRPYDVIVRYGGDEFLCAMPDISAPEARARFLKICHALAAADPEYAVSFGLAQSNAKDTLDEVIARADADLLARRAS